MFMKRKINRVGQNTLTVSLPIEFVKKYNIKQGDELDLIEQDHSLIISKQKIEKPKRKITLCLDKFNKLMLNRFMNEFYRQGFQEIELTFNVEQIYDSKNSKNIKVEDYVKYIIKRFIGMEIVSQTKNKIVLESLMSIEEYDKMEVVRNRIFFLIKEFTSEFIDAINNNFKEFHAKSYDYHDNISKFMIYYLRLLNFSDIPDTIKQRIFGLYSIIDKCIDKIRHASEDLVLIKSSSTLKKDLEQIFNLFLEMFNIFNKNYSFDDFDDLMRKRYELIKSINKIKRNERELKVIYDLRLLLDIVPDFAETFISINMEKCLKQ
jgi:phosphate uptake regulator